jgi:hypothetical protein
MRHHEELTRLEGEKNDSTYGLDDHFSFCGYTHLYSVET